MLNEFSVRNRKDSIKELLVVLLDFEHFIYKIRENTEGKKLKIYGENRKNVGKKLKIYGENNEKSLKFVKKA